MRARARLLPFLRHASCSQYCPNFTRLQCVSVHTLSASKLMKARSSGPGGGGVAAAAALLLVTLAAAALPAAAAVVSATEALDGPLSQLAARRALSSSGKSKCDKPSREERVAKCKYVRACEACVWKPLR